MEFLYFLGCPSHEKALCRLHAAAELEFIDIMPDIVEVKTNEQAESLKFIGSPTIRIDGVDMEQPQPGPPYRLACRAYRAEDGRISPIPSLLQIRRALRDSVCRYNIYKSGGKI